MKRIILLIAVTAINLSVISQVEKPITSGNIIFGGSINVEYNNDKTVYNPYSINTHVSNSFLIDLSPNLLYFIADHFAVGGLVTTQLFWDSDLIISLGLGPSFSYYADNGLVFGLQTKAYLSFFEELYETFFALNPFIGYAWFINSKVAIEPRINYNYYSRNFKGDLEGSYIKENRLFLNVTFSKFF